MSLVLSAHRRVYVLLLFHERLRSDSAPVARPLPRALHAALATELKTAEHGEARLVVSARMHRRWGRSLFGLSFFVLVLGEAGEPSASAA
jgi:hypothetical protein